MALCDQCGKQENMPYNCRFCGGSFCGDHRLPENHRCPGLEEWNDPSGVFDSGFDDSVRTQDGSGGIATRMGLDTGTGGPLSYFRGNMTYVFLALMWVTFFAQFFLANVLGADALVASLFVLRSDQVLNVWTWVTSIFAHGGPGHIFINSLVLYFFGPVVERRIGSRKFAALFLVSGAVAGLAQVLAVAMTSPFPTGVLGASGAIAAVMGVLTVLNPNLRIYLYFFIPMPLWLATALFAGWSIFASTAIGPGAGGVAQLAHLAGLVIGLLYGVKVRRDGTRVPQNLRFGGGGGQQGGRRRF